ncbi:MAG TPA: TfoX/Sxy family protein [Patescibacteria group bacterium]
MATHSTTIDFLLEQIQSAGNVRARKMFGEYALYCNDKVVALVCDDQLFVKQSSISSHFSEFYHEAPPYPNAKMYLQVSSEKWDDADWLSNFIRQTAEALPALKK